MKYVFQFLLVLGVIIPLHYVFAQTESVTLTYPNGGDCIKGGTTAAVTWTQTDIDHIAVYYRTDGSVPAWPSGTGLVDHPTYGTTYNWSVPSVTLSTARIYADGHDSGHSSLVQDGSNSNFSIDSTAPTAATVSSSGKTSTTVSLSWTASSDSGCEGLDGYKIFRNNSQVGSVGSGTTSYTDEGLSASTSYSYKVQAYDNFHSADSNTLDVITNAASSTPTPTASPASSSTGTPSGSTGSSGTSSGTTSSTTPSSGASTKMSTSSASPTVVVTTNPDGTVTTTEVTPLAGEVVADASQVMELAGSVNGGSSTRVKGFALGTSFLLFLLAAFGFWQWKKRAGVAVSAAKPPVVTPPQN